MTFCDQLKVRLTGLEEHFDLPALPVDPNDLFFRKIRSCTDERNPVFLVLFVAYTYDLCRDLMILPNHDVYRKKILAATSALLTDAEDLIDREQFPFVFIVNTGALLDHGDERTMCQTGHNPHDVRQTVQFSEARS